MLLGSNLVSEPHLCRRGLHDLSVDGARTADGRCRPCNAAYHREWRTRNPQNVQAVARYKATPAGYLVNALSGIRRRAGEKLARLHG